MSDSTAFLLALLLDWVFKSFLILGFTFMADLLLRRANASLRHLLWLFGLASAILLPAVSVAVPHWNLPLFHLDFLNPASARAANTAATSSSAAADWSASQILLGAYLAGALLVLAWQLVGRAYAMYLRHRATKITDGELTGELERLMAALEIRRPVDLLTSNLISIPFSMGYLRPVIVLPEATCSWPQAVLESVLIHELAHIKRRDILARLVAQVGCCIHWINPLAWYGLGRIIVEQEIACDNLVLRTGTKPSEYANNLLALAEVRRGRLDFALTAFGRRTELKSRLLEILKPTRSRAPLRAGGSLAFLLLTAGLILPVSALNLWDASDAVQLGDQVQAPTTAPSASVLVVPKGKAVTSAAPVSVTDINEMKQKISQKLQEMKAKGVPQAELDKFAAEAKSKISFLLKEQQRQAELNKSQGGKQPK